MTSRRTRPPVLVLAAAALVLSGCAQQDDDGPTPSPVVDTVPDDEEVTSSQVGPIQVETVTDGGIALVTTAVVLEGRSSPITGQLVTGPGGCLALDRQGPPVLLVLPQGSELSAGDRPSVTWDEVTVDVGGPLQLDAVAVPVDRLEGLPEGCGEDAAAEALVVALRDR